MEVRLVRAGIENAEEILAMQKKAFSALLDRYKDYDTSPANESLEKTLERLSQSYTYFYFIIADGAKVGAIRVVDKKNSEKKRISPIFILPQYRNNGYASCAIKAAEKIHGESGWEIDTIAQEQRLCRFYESLGYEKIDKDNIINSNMSLVFYEK